MNDLDLFVRDLQRADLERSSKWVVSTVGSLVADVVGLRSALDRTERNLLLAVKGRPVRDLMENLAENASARKGHGDYR